MFLATFGTPGMLRTNLLGYSVGLLSALPVPGGLVVVRMMQGCPIVGPFGYDPLQGLFAHHPMSRLWNLLPPWL
jgi:hypothetical protein